MQCSSCQRQAPPGASFCPECGARLFVASIGAPSREGERKQVTVVFCDIVRSAEYTRRLGAEGYYELVERFFAVASEHVHRLGGTINQFLGDGFMALFGAPTAHEEHARRAVIAALEFRSAVQVDDALSGLAVRIGINTGDVVVGEIGDRLHTDYTAFGDATVVAARLEAAASPGEILISGTTASAVRGYFELEPAETITVKERVLTPLRVIRVGERRSRLDHSDRRLTPFVGRDAELDVLTTACCEITSGRVVEIVGEAGIGKSRLAYECRDSLEHKVLEGRCVSFGANTPLLPILDLLRHTCGIESSDGRQQVTEKVVDALRRADITVEASSSFVLQLLGDPDAAARVSEVDPATSKARAFAALRGLWRGLAAEAPLVVILEDLHWIDRTSEDFLGRFIDELEHSSIAILTTARPEYAAPWRDRRHVTRLELNPLGASAGLDVIRSVAPLPHDLADSVIARAEGNPFFLEELASGATEAGGVTSVPPTVTDVLASRIDRLGEPAKRTIQTASVLGRDFTLGFLTSVVDDPSALDEEVARLKSLGLIFERRDAVDPVLVFKHALVQEVAYEGMLDSQRRVLHARVGRALEASAADRLDEKYELLAHHFSRGDDPEKAWTYLVHANRKAAAQNAMEEAIRYFYEALRVSDDLPDTPENRERRTRLILAQTGEFHFLHRHREYYDLLLQVGPMVDGLGEDALRGAYLARLGHREWTVLADFTRAAETLRQAIDVCERTGNDLDAGAAYSILAWTDQQLGKYAAVEVARDRALAKLETRYDPVWFNFAHCAGVVSSAFAGKWGEARQRADVAIDEGRRRSDSTIVSFNAGLAAFAFLEQRDWESASSYARLALAEAPTVYFEGFPQAFLASYLCSTDRLDGGLPILEAIVPMAEASEHRVVWMLVACLLADAYRAAGRDHEAGSLLEAVLTWAKRGNAGYFGARAHRSLGELAFAAGAPTSAADHFETAIAIATRTESMNELALALAARGRMSAGRGRMDLERALGILERLGTFEEPERIRAELVAVPV